MFKGSKTEKFSIRKFKIGVASAVIATSFFVGTNTVLAQENGVDYRYVLESELTDSERSQIISQLPSTVLGDADTYYMVYRPSKALPKTNSQNNAHLLAIGGISLLLVGIAIKKRKPVVTSLLVLLAGGQLVTVSAIEKGSLSGYDKFLPLSIGQVLPETVIDIPNHVFVGYILEDNCPNLSHDLKGSTVETNQTYIVSSDMVTEPVTESLKSQNEKSSVTAEPIIQKVPHNYPTYDLPELEIPSTETTSSVEMTEAPVTRIVTEAPVTRIVTEAPVTKVITEAPVTQIVTEAPVTKVITEAPVTRIVTEAPVSRVIAKPGQNLTHEKPEVQVVTETPVTRIVTEVPVSRIITEAPVTKIVTEAPVTRIETEPGTTRVVTEEAKTQVIGKAPALVQEEKPLIPIVTSKSIPLVEEKPEAPTPEITSKGENPPVLEDKPEIPIETSRSENPPVLEDKPEIPIETSKGENPLILEDKPGIPIELNKEPLQNLVDNYETVIKQYNYFNDKLEDQNQYTLVINTSKDLLEKQDLTQSELDNMVKSVETILVTLDGKVTDKELLRKEYEYEKEISVSDAYKYATPAISDLYKQLLDKANKVLTNNSVTQAQVDEALKLLTEARVKLNGLLVEEKEEKEFTRIIDFVDETGKSIRTAEEQKVKFIRKVIKNGNTGQVVETKDWTSVKDFFEKFVPPGIEGYKTDETEVPQLTVQVLATQETTRVSVRYNKVTEEKVKPDLKVTKLEKFDKEKRATLKFDLVDKDSTYVKGQVKVYNDKNELVQTVDIKDNKVDLSNLEHCIPYRLETVLTYNLGKGEVEEKVNTRTVELVDKKIEFKNLSSTELYKVDDTGKATQVTALTEKPANTADYMIKLVDSENKEILLAVSDIVEKNGKFQVSAKMDNLVHYSADKATEDFVFEVNKAESKPGYHTNFKDLITEMKANLSGQFFLATDLVAEPTADATYIPANFTGTLTSAPGSKFSITGLTKPLFNSLSGKVNNIELKDAVLTSAGANVGILANTATNATIDGITLTGSLNPTTNPTNIGSIAGTASGVKVLNTLVDVDFNLPKSAANVTYYAGGLFGKDMLTTVEKVTLNIDMKTPNTSINGQTIGGISGQSDGPKYQMIKVAGSIVADSTSPTVAALIGRVGMQLPTINNIVTEVKVTNGSIGNGANYMAMLPMYLAKNIYIVNGVASGIPQSPPQTVMGITQEEANKYVIDWKLPTGTSSSSVGATTGAGTAPTSSSAATYPVDYMQVTGAKVGLETAYKNLAKLLPFYDRKTIVKTANKLADGDKLKETEITSIVPMKGNDFVTDLFDTRGVNKLLVHFADGTVKEYDLTATGESPNARITEFRLDNGMLYTPHNFDQGQNNYASAIAKLQAVEYNSDEVAKVFNVTKDKLPDLYLETSFNEVKANLDQVLKSIMSNQVSADMTNGAVSRFVENELTKNKEKLLLGLAYLNRLYDINYGAKNIKDLAMYRPDFLTDSKVDNVAYLESLTDTTFDKFKLYEAGTLYKEKLAGINGESSIPEYLDKYRQLFASNKETKKWFLESSKAKIVEADTNIPNENNSIYDRLAAKDATHGNLLLLLNVADDTVYAVVHPGSISYGAYAPYMPKNTAAQVEGLVDKYAQRMTNYYNIWNNVIKEDMKSKFAENPVRIVDSHYPTSEAETWTNKYPNSGPINEFFGPAGYYHSHNPNESAYANRKTLINMVDDRLLDDASLATATHEFIHHFDEKVLFNGYKYRPGQNVESYALGLLESLSGERSTYYGFNTLYEFTPEKNINFNHSTTRFQSAQDMQDYMKGIFDVTYTLDALEADIMKSKPASDKQKLYQQVTLVPTEPVDGYTHADDSIIDLSNDIANKLTSIQAFVENGVVSKGILNVDGKQVFTRDNKNPNYVYVDLYKPIFAGLSNNAGTVGSLQFRRTALEFLAVKGWDEGFLKYATNKLAVDNGTNLTDPEVFKEIFGTQYANYADFKTKQFENHLADITKLKDITITLNGKQEVVNGTTIKGLMEKAVNEQLNPKNFQHEFALKTLKEAILTEYMKQTGDFKESIYK